MTHDVDSTCASKNHAAVLWEHHFELAVESIYCGGIIAFCKVMILFYTEVW